MDETTKKSVKQKHSGGPVWGRWRLSVWLADESEGVVKYGTYIDHCSRGSDKGYKQAALMIRYGAYLREISKLRVLLSW